ncbi:MAG: hypothetical protein QOI53_4018, partial [Verrucomicrobiota bacterium]|nr:hypothetical protein [Verrucomicrobiota bacterium]
GVGLGVSLALANWRSRTRRKYRSGLFERLKVVGFSGMMDLGFEIRGPVPNNYETVCPKRLDP